MSGQIILMKAVFIDQAQIAFGKGDVFTKNPLSEFSVRDICKLNIIMGVQLGFLIF